MFVLSGRLWRGRPRLARRVDGHAGRAPPAVPGCELAGCWFSDRKLIVIVEFQVHEELSDEHPHLQGDCGLAAGSATSAACAGSLRPYGLILPCTAAARPVGWADFERFVVEGEMIDVIGSLSDGNLELLVFLLEFHLKIIFCDRQGIELGGVVRGLGTCVVVSGWGTCEAVSGPAAAPSTSTRRVTPPMVRYVSGLDDLLPENPFAVDIGAVGTPQIPENQLLPFVEKLAMTAADLRGSDPDLAIVVAADTVDPIHQPQRVCPAAAAHDLKSIIHDQGYPEWLAGSDARGDENEREGTANRRQFKVPVWHPATQSKSPIQAIDFCAAWGPSIAANVLQSGLTALY